MNVNDDFEEIKDNLRKHGPYWPGHALRRFEERFSNYTRKELIDAIIINGEAIRYEWQKGYEPRVLVYAETVNHEPFHIAIKKGQWPVIVTLYNEFSEFEQDCKTRKKKYYSR